MVKLLKNKQKQLKIKERKKSKQLRKQLIRSNKDVYNESHKIFDELSYKRMSETNDLSKQIDLNNLTYYFRDKIISPINFIGFKAPLHLYRDIRDGNIKLAKAKEDQNQFKLTLNEITRGNPKKTEGQIKTRENIKNL